jgi:hypothetical protein
MTKSSGLGDSTEVSQVGLSQVAPPSRLCFPWRFDFGRQENSGPPRQFEFLVVEIDRARKLLPMLLQLVLIILVGYNKLLPPFQITYHR